MLDKLKDLVFGLNYFEKTKIDMRFKEISNVLEEIEILRIEDFEILEECIFKIKDLLRLPSSNLNRIINDKKKDLTQKEVDEILKTLEKIKYDFLQQMFSIIETNNILSTKKKVSVKNDLQKPISKKEKKIFTVSNNQDYEYSKSEEFSSLIVDYQNIKIIISSGANIPYVIMDFKGYPVNIKQIKTLFNVFSQLYSFDGLNIIIEKDKCLLIPRYQKDKLIEIPSIKLDLEDVFNSLTTKKEKNTLDISEKEVKKNIDDYPYYENPKLEKEFHKKGKDDNLDTLLIQTENKNKTFKPKINPFKDEDTVKVIKSDEDTVIVDRKTEIKNVKIDMFEPEKEDFVLYKDDGINITLNKNSKVLGDLRIKLSQGLTFYKLDEHTYNHIFHLSKIFSSILFDTVKSQGTNIIINYKSDEIKVLSRCQDDNLDIENFKKSKADESELEETKNIIIKTMVNNSKPEESKEKVTIEKKDEEDTNTTQKEKAEYILKKLRRIP